MEESEEWRKVRDGGGREVEDEGWKMRVKEGEGWRVRSRGKHKMFIMPSLRRTHSATPLTCLVTWFLPSKALNHLSG